MAGGQRTSLASLKVGKAASPAPAAPRWPATVKLADLADNPDNPRETLRELEGLADTIREDGILQDLVVVPRDIWLAVYPHHAEKIGDKPFVIHLGHRRRHAAELAGLVEVPVKVRETAGESEERALIENLQRDDLTPLEEARSLKRLMDLRKVSMRDACRRLGKSPAWGSQRLTLLNLTPELQEALAAGKLKLEQAREIGRKPQEQQALPTLAPAVPEPVREQSVHGVNTPELEGSRGVHGVNTPEPGPSNPPPSSGTRRNYGVITLSSPTEIAAELRERLPLEELETLTRLLAETTAR
jgi:ParB family chromosome partitioning protein